MIDRAAARINATIGINRADPDPPTAIGRRRVGGLGPTAAIGAGPAGAHRRGQLDVLSDEIFAPANGEELAAGVPREPAEHVAAGVRAEADRGDDRPRLVGAASDVLRGRTPDGFGLGLVAVAGLKAVGKEEGESAPLPQLVDRRRGPREDVRAAAGAKFLDPGEQSVPTRGDNRVRGATTVAWWLKAMIATSAPSGRIASTAATPAIIRSNRASSCMDPDTSGPTAG